jgi:hypothetical protein
MSNVMLFVYIVFYIVSLFHFLQQYLFYSDSLMFDFVSTITWVWIRHPAKLMSLSNGVVSPPNHRRCNFTQHCFKYDGVTASVKTMPHEDPKPVCVSTQRRILYIFKKLSGKQRIDFWLSNMKIILGLRS